jgi:hypothetical protein
VHACVFYLFAYTFYLIYSKCKSSAGRKDGWMCGWWWYNYSVVFDLAYSVGTLEETNPVKAVILHHKKNSPATFSTFRLTFFITQISVQFPLLLPSFLPLTFSCARGMRRRDHIASLNRIELMLSKSYTLWCMSGECSRGSSAGSGSGSQCGSSFLVKNTFSSAIRFYWLTEKEELWFYFYTLPPSPLLLAVESMVVGGGESIWLVSVACFTLLKCATRDLMDLYFILLMRIECLQEKERELWDIMYRYTSVESLVMLSLCISLR